MVLTQAYRRGNRQLKQDTGCRTGKEGQALSCTCGKPTDGFLRHRFQPLTAVRLPKNYRQREWDFFRNIEHLSELYGFKPLDVGGQSYPYNLYLSFKHAQMKLAQKDKGLELVLLEKNGRIRLATIKTASTASTLFYIPINTIVGLWGNADREKEMLLLQSVSAYLYQVVGLMDYHRYGYLSCSMDMIQTWLMDEAEEWKDDEWQEHKGDMDKAFHYGSLFFRKVGNPIHLQQWEQRLKDFYPEGLIQQELLRVSSKLFRLYTDYPEHHIFSKVHTGLLNPEEENRMNMGQVFCFTWSLRGWLHEQLMETTCAELNEMMVADEPMSIQYFDTPQQTVAHDIDFELRLYELLHELTDLLLQL